MKSKRVAALTALSVSLMIGGAAFAHDGGPSSCPPGQGEGTGAPGQGKGKGEGTGAPGKGKGQGQGTGAPSCKDHDQPGGGNNGGGGGHDGGTNDSGQNPVIDVTIDVEVTLPDLPAVTVPNALPLAKNAAGRVVNKTKGIVVPVVGRVQAAGDVAVAAAGQGLDLAKDDLNGALLMATTAADTAGALADGNSAEAAVAVSDGTVAGSFNLGTDADGDATTLGGYLFDGTLGLAGATQSGSAQILGSVLSAF